MKIKKILIISGFIAVVLIGGLLWWFTATRPKVVNGPANPTSQQSDNTINYKPPTQDEINAGESTKKNTIDSDQSSKSTPQPESTSITTTAKSVSSSTVSLRFMIDGVHTGTCALTLSGPSQQSITRSAPTQPLASTTTCQGFDIATSDLAKGQWSYVLTGTFSDGVSGQTSGNFSL